MRPASRQAATALVRSPRADDAIEGEMLERTVDNTGHAIRNSVGIDAALRAVTRNTRPFPASANAWDRLTAAYAEKGDASEAKAAYDRSCRLASASKD